MKKYEQVLRKVLETITPPEEDIKIIKTALDEFILELKKRIKDSGLNAEVFVGGSFAKNTLIKKENYDVDVFLRFDKKYKSEDISGLTKNLLQGMQDVSLIHGSRDYFRVHINPSFYIELIPVIKVNNPEESDNITDLSYSHVKYIKGKIKEKTLDEIRLAKAFCHARYCYGAESYIRGFSGYSLELLIYKYGSFIKFLKTISNMKEQTVVDIEKLHKNKSYVMMDLNSSKLHSPIILIDPTYKQRNALAALSKETFEKFKKECQDFLKDPSVEFFQPKKTDIEEIKKNAKENNEDFVLLEAQTDKQEGDIAGSKLLKFYNHLVEEISNSFEIKNKGFNYNKKKSARYFFVANKKDEILVEGPEVKDEKNLKRFKKKHADYFTKQGRIYSKDKPQLNLREFISLWKRKNAEKINEMSIESLKFV